MLGRWCDDAVTTPAMFELRKPTWLATAQAVRGAVAGTRIA